MADSRHEGLSPYAYVYNNPVLYSDHEGKFRFAGALIGGLIGAAASLTKSVIQNGFESLGDSRTWAKAGVNALGGALVGATGGLGLAYGLSTPATTAVGMAATAYSSFTTSIIEDGIDGKKIDLGKAAYSSFIATATFGFGKYGADKFMRNVRTDWWNRTNTNAFVGYLGKSPTTNVGQVMNRVVDVAGLGSSFSADYLFPSVSLITSSSTNNSDKPKSTVVVEPVQIIPPFDPNEKKKQSNYDKKGIFFYIFLCVIYRSFPNI